MTTENKPEPTAQELLVLITKAGEVGDIAEVIRLGNLLKKQKADIEKAEQEKLAKESEALAKDRESLATKILKALPGIITKAELEAAKATGFSFYLAAVDANGVETKARVALAVPTIKTKRTGGGGAGVSTKDQTGLNLADLIEVYGTDEEKVDIQIAYDEAENNKGSAKWQKQNQVKKRILADNPDLIKK